MPKKKVTDSQQHDLFPQALEDHKGYAAPRRFKPITQKIWTKNKSLLVSAYLRQFVYITWRGTYIDGFSGPQYPNEPDFWCARKVLETQKPFAEKKYGMGNYFLVESDASKIEALKELRDTHSENFKLIKLYEGDTNLVIDEILARPELQLKEPVFCLLDQHTDECHWNTVVKLATHTRPSEYKIEQFYFLATGWIQRVFGGATTESKFQELDLWWGDRSWENLKGATAHSMVELMISRFKELGYKHVTPWPIFKEGNDSGRIMYYMIHASDHEKAPQLMENAYHKIIDVRNKDAGEQLQLISELAIAPT